MFATVATHDCHDVFVRNYGLGLQALRSIGQTDLREHEKDDYAKMCDNENDVHRHSASRL